MKVSRVVIENVTPSVDGGRHPAKRIVGDRLEVGADLYKDGHDLIAARVRYRAPGERRWQHAPLAYDWPGDRWSAAIPLDRLGRWAFTVEGWPDHWGTFRSELRKRVEADQRVGSELLEGALLLRSYAASAPRAVRAALEAAAEAMADAGRPESERVAAALDESLVPHAAGPLAAEQVTRYEPLHEVVVDRERAGFGAWYELFPRSQSPDPGRHGTFADAERRLPELAALGFDVVYLPPIHPIGRAHRKGPNNTPGAAPGDPGSPWAIGGPEGGHTAVHPELGGLEAFERFVQAAKQLDLEIALDYALQCSPDHPWVKEHPDWFFRRPDGTIHYAENPPKKYQDIYPLDFWCDDREALWEACRDVFLFWIERGVRIFRVDNPHTKPFAFWEWCIRDVQERHPDAIFLAEAFTRPKRMYGLAKIGFTQSYTYFTWKNEWWELRELMEELVGPVSEFYRPNFFANTPDILHEYLQKGGRPAFRARLLLAGTLSPIYGIYSGFELCENVAVRPGSEEYLDSEKYQIRPRDWDAAGHIKEDVTLLNRLRREQPALRRLANLELLPSDNPQIFWFRKRAPEGDLFVAVNLDPHGTQDGTVHLPADDPGLSQEAGYAMRDLLTGTSYPWRGRSGYVRLDPRERPGHVFRLEREGTGEASA